MFELEDIHQLKRLLLHCYYISLCIPLNQVKRQMLCMYMHEYFKLNIQIYANLLKIITPPDIVQAKYNTFTVN